MHVLFVDDDDDFRQTISRRLARQGHEVYEAAAPQVALKAAREQSFEVALVDLVLPGMNGVELLPRLKEITPDTEVILLTGESSIDTAVTAIRRGAFDYLTKPCSFDALTVTLAKAAEHGRLHRDNTRLRAALERNSAASAHIIGQSPAIQGVRHLIEKAGPTESSVLVLGESGTGKELVARALHRLSLRAEKPMVTINCAALQETLLESELFGHEKGAFTGATAAKLGLFEVADGGTLFIDELGELAGGLQAKLLRVLEDGSLRRVGSTRETQVNVRVIAATNRDLREEVQAGRFRDDLYYRINVLSIEVPPLRDRREDIPLLTDYFLQRFHRQDWQVTSEVQTALREYDWPGNIRELANVIERATILTDGPEIRLEDLPELIGQPGHHRLLGRATTDASPDALAERERLHVAAVLAREGGSKVRTAKALGISRRSLYRLIEKYGLNATDHADES